uniref:(northern house mosquito) hypothetical protein n=1 Tax=Culex pipiens TaxID=7175 RepID=A0A8D8NVR3_CULPI
MSTCQGIPRVTTNAGSSGIRRWLSPATTPTRANWRSTRNRCRSAAKDTPRTRAGSANPSVTGVASMDRVTDRTGAIAIRAFNCRGIAACRCASRTASLVFAPDRENARVIRVT